MDDKISAVVGKLQQRLGDDYEVRIVDVTKNNDTVKKGISVRKEWRENRKNILLEWRSIRSISW